MSFEFVVTPTYRWLEKKLKSCQNRFFVTSPFIGSALLDLISNTPKSIPEKILITRTDIHCFAKCSSDIDTIQKLSEIGVEIRSLPGLHAKVYIIDNSAVLITSANATTSGLKRNWECGIAIEDPDSIREISGIASDGFGVKNKPNAITYENILSLKSTLANIKPIKQYFKYVDSPDEEDKETEPIVIRNRNILLNDFSGWMKLALDTILKLNNEFILKEVYEIGEREARKLYPDNQHIKAKLRQQLQVLRDLGFIKFMGKGKYLRVINILGDKKNV